MPPRPATGDPFELLADVAAIAAIGDTAAIGDQLDLLAKVRHRHRRPASSATSVETAAIGDQLDLLADVGARDARVLDRAGLTSPSWSSTSPRRWYCRQSVALRHAGNVNRAAELLGAPSKARG